MPIANKFKFARLTFRIADYSIRSNQTNQRVRNVHVKTSSAFPSDRDDWSRQLHLAREIKDTTKAVMHSARIAHQSYRGWLPGAQAHRHQTSLRNRVVEQTFIISPCRKRQSCWLNRRVLIGNAPSVFRRLRGLGHRSDETLVASLGRATASHTPSKRIGSYVVSLHMLPRPWS
jgi:hypothetical protein